MGADSMARPALPTRTSRSRRRGRHSSPYQLSVPPTAPVLVLAMPGPASAGHEVASGIADAAGAACPGVDVRVGFLHGAELSLASVLAELPDQGDDSLPAGVVVPVLASAHPEVSAAIADAAEGSGASVIVTGPLGPHPLLAEVLHARLAQAGLARAARAGRISITSEAGGVIVLAVGGEEALQAAGVVAVLLASRLALPVAAASLDYPATIRDAAAQLQGAGVTNMALSPCLIGTEVPPGTLESLSGQAGMRCAPPLGDNPAIGHLVAIRYGAALEDPKLAGLAR
ncbi:MAG TPA: CbiX/SirB N-terminal domain-containing protein [Streptosporangiaceae bacterium]|nr:CbiX/SirB N-terminal domain-containing protein [Streptosporangiaceae bacterium]